MANYGYADIGKLADFANNTIGGLTANDIMRFPRANVQPVKRGEWDFQGYQLFKCTNCKEIFTQNQLEAMQNHIDQEEFTFPNFCPNCGANMRGDTE